MEGRCDLRIARDKDGRLGVCRKAMLAQWHRGGLNPQLSEQGSYCGSLKSWRNRKRQRQHNPDPPCG